MSNTGARWTMWAVLLGTALGTGCGKAKTCEALVLPTAAVLAKIERGDPDVAAAAREARHGIEATRPDLGEAIVVVARLKQVESAFAKPNATMEDLAGARDMLQTALADARTNACD